MPVSKEELEKALKQFSPDQRGFAEAFATEKIENRQCQLALTELSKQHSDMYRILITILVHQPEKTIKIHNTKFLAFKEEYRIDRTYDEVEECVVLKLKTLTDD